jgi:HK97 family phage major capsid protein
MALTPETFSGAGWIPIGTDPNVIEQVKQNSFIETFGVGVPMTTRTKYTPRSGGVVMARAAAGAGGYTKDTASIQDSVLLTVDKFGVVVDLEDEDVQDTASDLVGALSNGAAASYARLIDNVSIGITAAKGTSGWNFDSLYYLLTQNDTNTGYVANSNIVTAATAGAATYKEYSSALAKLEGSAKWYDPANTVVGANPLFRSYLRGVLDGNGRPVFLESSAGMSAGAAGTGESLFGYPVRWSSGLALSAAGSESPTGRPLMVFANRNLIKRGDRSMLEAKYADADTSGYGFDSDVSGLKFRARKAFAPGALPGFSILVG